MESRKDETIPLNPIHRRSHPHRENSDVSRDDATKYGIGLFILSMSSEFGFLHYYFNGFRYGMRIRIALSSLIYRKTLRLSQQALSSTAPGKLVNLLSNDVQRFETLHFLHPLWIGPITSSLAAYILWTELRWAAIIGTAIIFVLMPIQSYVAKFLTKIRFETAMRTDERVRFMDEIVSGIQVIKMYNWEKPFEGLIATARRLELKVILKNIYVRAFNLTVFLFSNRIALFFTVLSVIWLYGRENMTVSKLFMTAYLFNVISYSINLHFIRSVSVVSEGFVAIKRLQTFLDYKEKDEPTNGRNTISSNKLNSQNLSILLENACAEWSLIENRSHENETEIKSSPPFRLEEINLKVPKGKLIFVVGSVGSGKSTLMQVLLKELPLVDGSMGINGTVSYASQVSWTFTSTIRQNITFGQPMDRSRYDEVVKCAALTKDFEQFSNGDLMCVGENGTGLSGGQKARINLARAMYRKADIYLIDDPLSAVDTHVQSHLFNKCVGSKGYLARQNATRILITHQLHFMKKADWIVVIKDGKIEMQGNYDTVLMNGLDINSILKRNENDSIVNGNRSLDLMQNRKSSLANSDDEADFFRENTMPFKEITFTKELEASSKGKIKGSLILNYIKSSKVPCALALLCTLFLITQAIASTADIWVSYWIRIEESRVYRVNSVNTSNQTSPVEPTLWEADEATDVYAYVYCAIMCALLLVAIFRSVFFSLVCTKASQNLHDTMFHALISTNMKFFNENPAGRVMNRFTKDMGSADEMLPITLLEATQIILLSLGSITVTIFTDVKLSVVILVLIVLFFWLRKLYLKCSTNIKRLEGITKSPVFTHISATLNGLPIVRAFQAEKALQDEFEKHQNLNTGTWFMFIGASYGFGVCLDLLVYIFVGIVIYIFLVVNEGVTGDRVGLAITQTLGLLGSLQSGIRQSADVINQLTSVERILEYSQLKPEKQPQVPQKVPSDWPSKGKIEFKNVSYRYSADDEPVLRGLSFSIKPSEKFSIVGRTGAGKSSLISSIYRLAIEEGDILLDDVNTSLISLSTLRSRISIIPQEPILFSGTLRRNLDPFEEYSDGEIWRALDMVELKELVSKNNGLDMPVLAHGQNFSTGQRQILCLARAIMRKSRIIILDEATANVDLRTDEMIQKTIREKFTDSTVITVAHRLNTVIDSDRVLVMDAGAAAELDAPHLLMSNENGIFRKMVEALGKQEFDHLCLRAKEHFDKFYMSINHKYGNFDKNNFI
ncbi:multidrug resistance-associated protein 4-like isoform X2 [Contarinia nasturtii]|uniref:multidrug resistance-associated protein 4-like isoform X2 n=1 Tax=Contarinia nasturtii TaxID=265458 RepID=UPI0012D3A163|nr:multidrug resistance-associated protein 4-like isoform X2 [Contarinia nasturtii]